MKSINLAVLCSLASVAGAQPTYTVTDLGDLPGGLDLSYGQDMNEHGVVVGGANVASGEVAFRWSRATGMVALPLLPGTTQSTAHNINAAGQIDGNCFVSVFPDSYRPAVWHEGQLIDPGLPQDFTWALAGGMNDHGVIVGWGGTASGRKPFSWTLAGGYQVGSIPSGHSEGGYSDINNKGVICGWADNDPILWKNGAATVMDLPTGGVHAFPNLITDEGRVGGYVGMGGGTYAGGQWNLEGEFLQMPQFSGYPSMDCFSASPEGGLIFGSAWGPDFERVIVWNPIDGLKDVNTILDPSTPGWTLQAAFTTPEGTLVGWGVINGVQHAAVAVPVVNPVSINVALGKQTEGVVGSLKESDGESVRVCKFIVPNQQVAPVTVEFDARSPIKSPHAYRLRMTTRVTSAGSFSQTVDLFDWSTNSFSPTDTRTEAITTSMSQVELIATGSLARYVGPGRTLRARLRVKPTGPVGSAQWCADVDQVQFVTQL